MVIPRLGAPLGVLQVKQKGARRITFEQFLTALAAVSDTKQVRQPSASELV